MDVDTTVTEDRRAEISHPRKHTLTHTHTRTHARARKHTHARTHRSAEIIISQNKVSR